MNWYSSPIAPPVVPSHVIVTPSLNVCADPVIATVEATIVPLRAELPHLNVLGLPVPSIIIVYSFCDVPV